MGWGWGRYGGYGGYGRAAPKATKASAATLSTATLQRVLAQKAAEEVTDHHSNLGPTGVQTG